MRGFSEVESFDPDKPGPADLDVDDHVLSLVYIARLASV
jgi:flagellar protein FlaE